MGLRGVVTVPSPVRRRTSGSLKLERPIGTAVMETAVLKEPRGVMRILEFFFAILAFAICSDFTTYLEYKVTCSGGDETTVRHNATYPFVLGYNQGVNVQCKPSQPVMMAPPGDFSSDAKFFVFTGVISFLGSAALLVLYVFFDKIYSGDDKRIPLMDFVFTLIVAVFWLSASAAWANGLVSMKSVYSGKWISAIDSDSICALTTNGKLSHANVEKCSVTYQGSFGGANVSVLFGFLNCFLWGANLWFIYKETAWFAARTPANGAVQLDA